MNKHLFSAIRIIKQYNSTKQILKMFKYLQISQRERRPTDTSMFTLGSHSTILMFINVPMLVATIQDFTVHNSTA